MSNVQSITIKLFTAIARAQQAVGRAVERIPFWPQVVEVARTITAPLTRLCHWTLATVPALRKIDWLLEIEALAKRHPVPLAFSLVYVFWRGLRPTPLGHIGTDTTIYPFLAIISGFNPFLGLICGAVFGAGDIVQKLFWNDIFGASAGRTSLNYWGAIFGYIIAYSSTMTMGVFPGIMSRVFRHATRQVLRRFFFQRAAASADGATRFTDNTPWYIFQRRLPNGSREFMSSNMDPGQGFEFLEGPYSQIDAQARLSTLDAMVSGLMRGQPGAPPDQRRMYRPGQIAPEQPPQVVDPEVAPGDTQAVDPFMRGQPGAPAGEVRRYAPGQIAPDATPAVPPAYSEDPLNVPRNTEDLVRGETRGYAPPASAPPTPTQPYPDYPPRPVDRIAQEPPPTASPFPPQQGVRVDAKPPLQDYPPPQQGVRVGAKPPLQHYPPPQQGVRVDAKPPIPGYPPQQGVRVDAKPPLQNYPPSQQGVRVDAKPPLPSQGTGESQRIDAGSERIISPGQRVIDPRTAISSQLPPGVRTKVPGQSVDQAVRNGAGVQMAMGAAPGLVSRVIPEGAVPNEPVVGLPMSGVIPEGAVPNEPVVGLPMSMSPLTPVDAVVAAAGTTNPPYIPHPPRPAEPAIPIGTWKPTDVPPGNIVPPSLVGTGGGGFVPPGYPLAELIAAILGAAGAGWITMHELAPHLEMPAFTWRPNPDISCHNMEVGTYLQGKAGNAAAAGVVGGAGPTLMQPPPGAGGSKPPSGGGSSTEDLLGRLDQVDGESGYARHDPELNQRIKDVRDNFRRTGKIDENELAAIERRHQQNANARHGENVANQEQHTQEHHDWRKKQDELEALRKKQEDDLRDKYDKWVNQGIANSSATPDGRNRAAGIIDRAGVIKDGKVDPDALDRMINDLKRERGAAANLSGGFHEGIGAGWDHTIATTTLIRDAGITIGMGGAGLAGAAIPSAFTASGAAINAGVGGVMGYSESGSIKGTLEGAVGGVLVGGVMEGAVGWIIGKAPVLTKPISEVADDAAGWIQRTLKPPPEVPNIGAIPEGGPRPFTSPHGGGARFEPPERVPIAEPGAGGTPTDGPSNWGRPQSRPQPTRTVPPEPETGPFSSSGHQQSKPEPTGTDSPQRTAKPASSPEPEPLGQSSTKPQSTRTTPDEPTSGGQKPQVGEEPPSNITERQGQTAKPESPEPSTPESPTPGKKGQGTSSEPEVEILKPAEGTGHAAEGGWSPEALSRMQNNRFFRRTTDGRMVEITDPTAIDTPPGRRETVVVMDKNTGQLKDVVYGDGIRPNEKVGIRNRIEDQVRSAGATDTPGGPPRKVDNEGDPNVVSTKDIFEEPAAQPPNKLVIKPDHPGIDPAVDAVGPRQPGAGSKPWSPQDPNVPPVKATASDVPQNVPPQTISTSPADHFYGHDTLGRPNRASAWLEPQQGTNASGTVFGDLERGHLVPNQYGGRGDITVPMTGQANSSHVRSIENAAKPYLEAGYAVKLDVEVTYLPGSSGTMPDKIIHNLTVVDPATGKVVTTIGGEVSAATQNTWVGYTGPGVVKPLPPATAQNVLADDSALPGGPIKWRQ